MRSVHEFACPNPVPLEEKLFKQQVLGGEILGHESRQILDRKLGGLLDGEGNGGHAPLGLECTDHLLGIY